MTAVACGGCGIETELDNEMIRGLAARREMPYCESCAAISVEWGPPVSLMLMATIRFARIHGCNCCVTACPGPGGLGAHLHHHDPCPLLRASMALLN